MGIRKYLKNTTLRNKLVAIVMVTCIVSFILAGVGFVAWEWYVTRQNLVTNLTTQARIIADNCKAALAFEDMEDAHETLSALLREPSVVFGSVNGLHNDNYAEYRHQNYDDNPSAQKVVQKSSYHFSKGYLHIYEPVRLDGRIIGYIHLISNLQPVYSMLRRNCVIIVIVLVLASIVAFRIAASLQKIISDPILSLANISKQVSQQKDYTVRAQRQSNDEIGTLFDAFNDMLNQIARRDKELVRTNETLESRVQQRTAELQKEVVVRKKAEDMLRQRTEQIIRHQAALLQLANIDKTDTELSMKMITEISARTLNTERVSIWFFNDEHTAIICRDLYLKTSKEHQDGAILTAEDHPFYFSSLESSRIIAAHDAVNDPQTSEFAEDYLKPMGITSMLDVPIRLHGKMVGVLCHEHIGELRQWSLEEQDYAASVADTIALVVEVGQRRKAEEQIKQSRQNLKKILDSMPFGVLIIDRQHMIQQANFAALNLSGYETAEELIGKKCNHTLCPTDVDRCPFVNLDQEVDKSERVLVTKDGEKIPILKSVIKIKLGGEDVLLETFVDISERKRTEKALEAVNRELERTVDQLSSANRELQDFTHIAAHDLKAPLRAIGTMADWLWHDYAEQLDAEGQKQLRLILTRSERMSRLIDAVLKYSEIGRGQENRQQIDMNQLIEGVIGEMNLSENIDIQFDRNLPVIEADPGLITQVFRQLIDNAAKYMDKENGWVRIGCRDQDTHWQFSVSDNGPGIDPKYHRKIFQVFQTLARRDEIENVGIGLAVTQKIIEMYEGKIWLDSQPGRGSTFYFTLSKERIGGLYHEQHQTHTTG